MNEVNTLACALIFVWATWCVLHPKINDGVVGKVLFSGMAFSAMAVVFNGGSTSGTSMHIFIAALGVRHMAVKHWPQVKCLVYLFSVKGK